MPKISIIVPVYNVDSYLKECLESIKSQQFTDFECICVNSSTTKESTKILNEYAADKRFKVINTPVEGVSKARNTGILNAKGEWLSFIDANDFVTSDYLLNLYENAVETNVFVVANTNVTKYYSKTSNRERSIKNQNGVFDITPSLVYNAVGRTSVWNKLYRADFVKETGVLFPEGKDFEDSYFYYCLIPHLKQISIINKPSYFYRVKRVKPSDDALFSNHDEQLLDIFLLIKDYYKKHDFIDKFILPYSILKAQLKNHGNKKHTLDKIYEILSKINIDYTKLSDKDARFVKDIKDKKFLKLWMKSWF